jgi:trimethylamine---corrinoid protein Co-methyltransferase
MAFGTVSSAPNCSDADGGRRSGTLADYRNFLKLGQVFNCIHFIGGYPVEPIDVHPSVRHLVALKGHGDAHRQAVPGLFAGARAHQRRHRDRPDRARRVPEQLEREPSICSIINTNSPLKLDTPMLQGIMALSSRNQACA